MMENDYERYLRLPNIAWIKRTIPKSILEGVVHEITPPKRESSRRLKLSTGFEDIVYFTEVAGLGYYCKNPKGFKKAKRAFVHNLEGSLFEKHKRTVCDHKPTHFPCIVKFHIDKADSLQVLYEINTSHLNALGALNCK